MNERLGRTLAWKLHPDVMMRDGGMAPDPHQVELLLDKSRQSLVLWPRQSGKTQAVSARILHQACFDPGEVIILSGERQKQALDVFDKILALHEALSEQGELPCVRRVDDELLFGNKSRVRAVPAKVDSIRGPAVKLAFVDEAAFTEDDTLAKISPMLTTTRGRLICASTPNGASGWFWDKWHHGGPGWHRLTVTIEQMLGYPNPRICAEEIARQRDEVLTPIQFRQEFGLEWLDGEQQVFPTETIEAFIRHDVEPLFA